jgi:hypothetical protein
MIAETVPVAKEPPPDQELLTSVRLVLAAVISVTKQPDLTAEQVRALAEVLEGQAKVLREAAGGPS